MATASAMEEQLGASPSQRIMFCPFDGYCFVLDEMRCARCGEKRSNIGVSSTEESPPSWAKVLYKKQQYEDNYTDRKTFLRELKKNVNVVAYSYRLLMMDSLVVVQQFSVVLILVTVFFHTLNQRVSPRHLNMLSLGVTILGGVAYAGVSNVYRRRGMAFLLECAVKCAGYIFGLHISLPLLCSLTNTISDGTISVLSTCFLIMHLVFQDYAYLNYSAAAVAQERRAKHREARHAEASHREDFECTSTDDDRPPVMLKYRAPISLNAATLTLLMLASRLDTHVESFSILALSIILFALIPIFAHHVQQYYPSSRVILPLILTLVATLLCYLLSGVLTLIFLSVVTFTAFVSPFCMQWIQHYKNKIHGPWDEAIPGT